MAEHGKRYQDAAKLIDRDRIYPSRRRSSSPARRPT